MSVILVNARCNDKHHVIIETRTTAKGHESYHTQHLADEQKAAIYLSDGQTVTIRQEPREPLVGALVNKEPPEPQGLYGAPAAPQPGIGVPIPGYDPSPAAPSGGGGGVDPGPGKQMPDDDSSTSVLPKTHRASRKR